jgi:hypothetical protein
MVRRSRTVIWVPGGSVRPGRLPCDTMSCHRHPMTRPRAGAAGCAPAMIDKPGFGPGVMMQFATASASWAVELDIAEAIAINADRQAALSSAVETALLDASDAAAIVLGIERAIKPLGLAASVEVLDLRGRSTTVRIPEDVQRSS